MGFVSIKPCSVQRAERLTDRQTVTDATERSRFIDTDGYTAGVDNFPRLWNRCTRRCRPTVTGECYGVQYFGYLSNYCVKVVGATSSECLTVQGHWQLPPLLYLTPHYL